MISTICKINNNINIQPTTDKINNDIDTKSNANRVKKNIHMRIDINKLGRLSEIINDKNTKLNMDRLGKIEKIAKKLAKIYEFNLL